MNQELKFTTVTGKTLDEVRRLLDAPLPEEAYKKVGGNTMDLTDISPAWTRRALTSIFGLFGFGWGMNHDGADIELRFETKTNGKDAAEAVIKRAKFWYVLLDGEGKPKVFSFTCTGANRSEQGNGGWALKGAVTNALSSAASFIGFQESVYMGKRSHHDTTGKAPASGMSIDPAKTVNPSTAPETHATGKPEDSGASVPSGTPPTSPGTTPPAETAKTLLHFACDGCGHPISEYARPDKCPKCGNGCLRPFPTLAAAKRHTPQIPQEPPAETATDVPTADAPEQPCMACGSVVPVTPSCPDCGAETISSDTRALTDEMNRLTGKNRAVLLRRASKVTGRTIKGYAEMGIDDLRALVYDLRITPMSAEEGKPPSAPVPPKQPSKPAAAGPVPPVPPAAAGGNGSSGGSTAGASNSAPKLSKVQLIQEIFKAAGAIGIATPASIVAELSTRWKRTITSTAELTVDELETSLREFRGVKP